MTLLGNHTTEERRHGLSKEMLIWSGNRLVIRLARIRIYGFMQNVGS